MSNGLPKAYMGDFEQKMASIDLDMEFCAENMDLAEFGSVEYDGWLYRYNQLGKTKDSLQAEFNQRYNEEEQARHANEPAY